MARGVADVVEIVVLAAGAHAFLAGGGADVVAVLEPGEDVLELDHARVGEHQRRVVARHQGRAGDDAVVVSAEIVEKGRANVVQARHGFGRARRPVHAVRAGGSDVLASADAVHGARECGRHDPAMPGAAVATQRLPMIASTVDSAPIADPARGLAAAAGDGAAGRSRAAGRSVVEDLGLSSPVMAKSRPWAARILSSICMAMSGLSLRIGLGVLAALADALIAEGIPGAGLLDDAGLDADVDQLAALGDALAVHDVELDLLEGRRDLVLDHLDAGGVADDLVAVLDRADAADVETDARRRTSARCRRMVVSGEPNITPIFMRIWLMKITMQFERLIAAVSLRIAWLISRAWAPTWASPISPSSSDFGVSAATESTTTTETAPERTSVSVISSACSPVSGWEISSSSMLTPSFLA